MMQPQHPLRPAELGQIGSERPDAGVATTEQTHVLIRLDRHECIGRSPCLLTPAPRRRHSHRLEQPTRRLTAVPTAID
jgi:hypothetical protein